MLCVVCCVLFDVVCLTLCVWRLVFDVWCSVRVLGCPTFVQLCVVWCLMCLFVCVLFACCFCYVYCFLLCYVCCVCVV